MSRCNPSLMPKKPCSRMHPPSMKTWLTTTSALRPKPVATSVPWPDVTLGDMEKGFAESDIVLEDTFSTQIQHQASMETHAALAEEDVHGRLTVWSTTQKPFAMRRYLSQSLKLPMNSIRVKATKIGGGFGGKLELLVEPYAVLLARKCGRPVQIVYPRDEEFLATTPRHKTYFWVKSGIKK